MQFLQVFDDETTDLKKLVDSHDKGNLDYSTRRYSDIQAPAGVNAINNAYNNLQIGA